MIFIALKGQLKSYDYGEDYAVISRAPNSRGASVLTINDKIYGGIIFRKPENPMTAEMTAMAFASLCDTPSFKLMTTTHMTRITNAAPSTSDSNLYEHFTTTGIQMWVHTEISGGVIHVHEVKVYRVTNL